MKLEVENRILEEIDQEELVELVLALGNIYSPTGQEKEIATYIHNWMENNGFNPRLIGPTAERANVLGCLKGTGGGLTLAFNSHMDITMGKNEYMRLKVPDQKIYYEAWLDGDKVYGNGVVNDKGPMAAWMIAVKALKKSGVKLKGDILMAAVVGEIGHEPVDEFTGLEFIGKDFGTRYLLTHGGTADLAIVAETSGFSPGWVEAGKTFFKITVMAGPSRYTPYIEHVKPEKSPNAIVRSAALIPLLEDWAREYEEKNTTTFKGGTVIPKASIAAIRGGLPYLVIRPPEICSLYLDVRLLPGANPLNIREEILGVLIQNGFEGDVEIYVHRPGLEAKGVEKILPGLGKAHKVVSGEEMVFPPAATVTSMWRDTNPYIEFGIPAVTYGPGEGSGSGANSLTIDELLKAAKIYALAAYYIGQLEREKPGN